MDMENKKIFLSSSITEFKSERDSIGNYIRMLNQEVFMAQGIYLWLLQCEDYSKAVGTERKQDRYNRDIADSDYFYALIGEKAGERTVEELDMALEGFRQRGLPKVYTYFKSYGGSISRDPSVSELMSRIETEMGHDCSRFTELDSVKLDMLIELLRDHPGLCEMRFDKGEVMINGRVILSLENIPIYSKNETIQGLNSQLEKLSAEFDDISKQIDACPEDENLKVKRFRISKNIDDISEKLADIENNLLSFYRNIICKRSESNISIYERRALRLVEEGDYEGALAILRDGQLKKDLDLAVSMAEAAKERIRQYISGQRTRIEILKTQGINVEREKEIIEIYEEITSLSEKYFVEISSMTEYAYFLYQQKQYSEGIKIAKRIEQIYNRLRLNNKIKWADLYFLKANLINRTLDFDEIELNFQKAFDIYSELTSEKDDCQLEMAKVCHKFADFYFERNDFSKAEQLYREAMNRYQNQKEDNILLNREYVKCCCSLGFILRRNDDKREARFLYQEALSIEKKLIKKYNSIIDKNLEMRILYDIDYLSERKKTEDIYQKNIINLLNETKDENGNEKEDIYFELGEFFEKKGEYDNAEKYYSKALIGFEKAAAYNPHVYIDKVAETSRNLARSLNGKGLYDEAKIYLKKALDIYIVLSQENGEVYKKDVALILGILEAICLDPKEKMNYLQRELDIYEDLGKIHSFYKHDILTVYYQLIYLSIKLGEENQAEIFFQEQIKHAENEKNDPIIGGKLLVRCYLKYGDFLVKRNRYDDAEIIYEKAFEVEIEQVIAGEAYYISETTNKLFEIIEKNKSDKYEKIEKLLKLAFEAEKKRITNEIESETYVLYFIGSSLDKVLTKRNNNTKVDRYVKEAIMLSVPGLTIVSDDLEINDTENKGA